MARKSTPPAPAEDLSFKAYIRQLADDGGDAGLRHIVDTFAEEDRAAGKPDTILQQS